jgi:hypothetical protein
VEAFLSEESIIDNEDELLAIVEGLKDKSMKRITKIFSKCPTVAPDVK